MTQTKHTPAPWHIDEILNGLTEDTDNGIFDSDGFLIAHVWRNSNSDSNALLIAASPELESALCNLLEWAKGNRGTKSGNPYTIPEVKSALQLLAKIQGIEDYLDAKTSE